MKLDKPISWFYCNLGNPAMMVENMEDISLCNTSTVEVACSLMLETQHAIRTDINLTYEQTRTGRKAIP